MRKNLFLLMAAMVVLPLQSLGDSLAPSTLDSVPVADEQPAPTVAPDTRKLQELADSMSIAQPAVGQKQLDIPAIPGVEVSLLGCDYEQIINNEGEISPVLSDTPVRVSFKLRCGAAEVCSRDYELIIPAAAAKGGNAKPEVVPDLLQWQGAEGNYSLGNTISVGGGSELARELAADIRELFGREMSCVCGAVADKASIQLQLKGKPDCKSEAYELDIRPECVIISAEGARGLYWGTRSLLQILRQGNGTAPCGKAYDAPRYALRGFMLDVGRLPVPLSEVRNIIRTMAWYKMNDLQLHLNDNYIWHEHYVDKGEDPFKRSYAAFRLESQMRGADGTPLTAQDLSYSKSEFVELVRYAARHGVSIVPEFDTPGHALSFTRVRPDLIYQGPMSKPKRRCEMLDAANPETLRFSAEVWDEYLLRDGSREGAVFSECPVVHVGSDEFYGDKEDYRRFADGMLRHVLSRGYTPRIWGSLHAKRGKTPVVAEGVQVNLWSGGWAKAWDSIRQGYDVINTDDGCLYIVPFANYYRMDQNHKWLYNHWNINNVHGQVLPSGHPQFLGAMFAVWQDYSDRMHNGYMTYDYWPSLRGSIDVLSEKMWGQARPPRNFEEHRALVNTIGTAPRTDMARRVGTVASEGVSLMPSELPMQLGNGSLGPNWHLTMELTLDAVTAEEEQVLLDSPEGQLLAVGRDGCIGFRRADTMLFSYVGAKLPVGERVKLELIGKPGSTQLLLNGQPVGTLTLVTHHNRTEELLSTFILPLENLGTSFKGSIHSIQVLPTAP